MYSPLQLVIKYVQFWWRASNGKGHGVHSPFVYNFIRKVLIDTKRYPAYDQIIHWRNTLLEDQTRVVVQDLGAGSRAGTKNNRSIAAITKSASKSKKIGRLLYRIVQYYQPATILELGTSMGLSTAYFSLANPRAAITTIEGVPAISTRASVHFQQWKLTNINLVTGNFDEVLPSVLNSIGQIDFVFVDGNHRKEPTLKYFELLMQKAHPNTMLVFDDIHWSADMEEAWSIISTDKRVKCSIDLFYMGIILLRTDFYQLENFSIRL
jgi:predicted O-methyltransferase YrrM